MSDHTEPIDGADANDIEIDTQVLAMRRSGKSYGSIATTLNLGRPSAANAAFNRAVRRFPPARRQRLCNEELGRLRKLEDRVRGNAELAPFDRDRQLKVIDHLRDRLQAP